MYCISEFCKEFDISKEATEYLIQSYEILKNKKIAWETFSAFVFEYYKSYEFDHTHVFDSMGELSKVTGIHKFTLDFLFMVSLVPHLKRLYEQKGIEYNVLYDSVCDLKWKLKECKDVYDIWGTFVSWWTIDFFKLKRFAFGRLQFNLRTFSRDYEYTGAIYKQGDPYIDVHIPSNGPLNHDECVLSYNRAAEFFKEHFKGKPIIFGCGSWLLSPNNYKILPPSSNIIPFMRDYTVLEEIKDEKNSNLWRIFAVNSMPSDLENLPQDTSLRRAFVNWLQAGNSIDAAFAIFRYDEIGN